MTYTPKDHVFALCAYGKSEYLEDCIVSLEKQSCQSSIILCTATPSNYLDEIADRHHLQVYVNSGPHGIAEDWNFAYAQANVPLVTLAHQDDVYNQDYLVRILESVNRAKEPLIAFTDYYEVRNGVKVFTKDNRNLRVKELALMPLRPVAFQSNKWIRRRVLSICNPICCPAVTYVKGNLPPTLFESHFASNLDWQTWEKISKLKGSFCYIHEALMGHRIHGESTTTKVIGDNSGRTDEDLEMYLKFWPRWVAVRINKLYSAGQDSNKI